jgi:HAD superfamily hydrolase (TIGR01450 family)
MIILSDIECFILDMDGTIYLGERVLPGAPELLRLLEARGTAYYFFTNNSSASAYDYIAKLKRLWLGVYERKSIITSVDVTIDYIKRTYGANASAYVVGTPALVEQLKSAGIECADSGRPDCLVVGFDTTLRYERANRALELLREGVPFLGVNIDAVCPLDGGKVLLDCGSICAMLTHASGVKPKFLGKPFSETAEYICKTTGIPPGKTAVVGDRLYTDMRFAAENGMCSIGVLSGEMTREDIYKSDLKLDYVFSGVQELCDILKQADI